MGEETLSKNASSYSNSNSLLGIYDLKDFSLVHSVLVKKEQGFKKIAFDANGVYLVGYYVLNHFHLSQRGEGTKFLQVLCTKPNTRFWNLMFAIISPNSNTIFQELSIIEFGNNLVAIQHHIKTPIFQLNTMETLLVGVHLDEFFICDLVEKGCKGFIKSENPSHIIVSKDAKYVALADKKGKIKIFSW